MRNINILVFLGITAPFRLCPNILKIQHDKLGGKCMMMKKWLQFIIIQMSQQTKKEDIWLKAVNHSRRWQRYFTEQISSRETVVSTNTKVTYDDGYCFAMVRQVQCFSEAGKKLYDSGDDPEGDWGPVNASDPVGIVGEFLGK